MLIIIGIVVALEKIFFFARKKLRDTKLNDMFTAMFDELMIVCCMSFVFKIVVNQYGETFNHPWLIALEYADVLVPITTFVYCLQGGYLVLVSIHYVAAWRKVCSVSHYVLTSSIFPHYLDTVTGLR